MTKALRGINLGGWLVAERWMTPSLFKGVPIDGERAITDYLGRDEAARRLNRHRDTFITEADFARIAADGFDFVRLPVGYWLFGESTGFIDGEVYVQRAFQWAERHGLGVVLDFHGLQGSQNGLDHSGQVGKIRFYRRRNRVRALRTLEYMCKAYGDKAELIGIEIINEPKVRWCLWPLLRYYDRAIRLAERSLRPDTKIIVSDGFKPLRMARALSRRRYSSRVVLDVHLYQVFTPEDQQLSIDDRLAKVYDEWGPMLEELTAYMPVLVGEWSAALPSPQAEPDAIRRYYSAQQTVYDDRAWGHSYWSHKAPSQGAWEYGYFDKT